MKNFERETQVAPQLLFDHHPQTIPNRGLTEVWQTEVSVLNVRSSPGFIELPLYLELELALVREALDHSTGIPNSLYLAYATPRSWVEEDEEITVTGTPTWLGLVAHRIRSNARARRVSATVEISRPERPKQTKLKLRVPGRPRIQSVATNGRERSKQPPSGRG